MAYRLMIKKGNSYIPIKIRIHNDFIIDSNIMQDDLATLKEIDLLTTQYSECDFRRSLLRQGLISQEDFNNQIEIRYFKKKFITLKNSIIFKEGKSYLDVDTLENTMNVLCRDNNFVIELINKYMPKEDGRYNTREYVNLGTLKILEGLLSNNININGLKSFLIPYNKIFYDKNLLNNLSIDNRLNIIQNIMKIFIYNELYERRKYLAVYDNSIEDFRDVFEFNREKIKYKALHDLAKFVYNYDSNRRKEEIKEEKECQEEFLEPEDYLRSNVSLSRSVEQQQTKPKKRVKRKKEPLEGQTSFFD